MFSIRNSYDWHRLSNAWAFIYVLTELPAPSLRRSKWAVVLMFDSLTSIFIIDTNPVLVDDELGKGHYIQFEFSHVLYTSTQTKKKTSLMEIPYCVFCASMPLARAASVPDSVKAELLQRIRAFLVSAAI